MANRYLIPSGTLQHEIEARRSRFRASIGHAATIEDARAFIQELRDADPTATHHCWAYLIGPPGSSDRVGMSDDGEPHGTAGRPMLQVLSHSPVGDVVAVVTRWYGGVKLGTGGLVRAYSDAVREGLERISTTERIEWCGITIGIDYAGVDPLRRLLPAYEAELIDESYTERAVLTVRLPLERSDAFREQVIDMSNGTADLSDSPL